MINKAKENYPQLNFMQGDANQSILYNPEQFGLITILYFTIYYMKDKKTVFKIVMIGWIIMDIWLFI